MPRAGDHGISVQVATRVAGQCETPNAGYNRRVVGKLALAAVLVVGCDTGKPPDIVGLSDQVAVVGQQFILEIAGVDPDGDRLTYGVTSDLKLDSNATLTQTPVGHGLFKWTPVATDIGAHLFDFTVSDGDHDATLSIQIDVRSGSGAPIFRQPLGTGRVINLATDPCITVDIVVEDSDTAQVTIAEEEPWIAGGQFNQLDGTTAEWRWCPTPQQVAETDRYTLTLSADDADNPKAIKDYILVIGGASGPALVLNEIDYDNIGTDTIEYVELLNASNAPTSLAGVKLALVNGATNSAYATIDLTPIGSLAAGTYLVVAGSSVFVPTSAVKLDPLWTQDQVQNGDADGVAVIDDVTHTVIDALSYEGSITSVTLPGFTMPISLVEGTPLPLSVADSNETTGTVCRIPNGQDTNNAATDWKFCTSRTAGTANAP